MSYVDRFEEMVAQTKARHPDFDNPIERWCPGLSEKIIKSMHCVPDMTELIAILITAKEWDMCFGTITADGITSVRFRGIQIQPSTLAKEFDPLMVLRRNHEPQE